MKKATTVDHSKENTLITSSQAAEILGISVAKVRNWVKLKKLKVISHNPLVFSREAVLKLHEGLEDSELLKSRRNKTRSSENFIPKNYISSSSPNYPVIKEVLEDASDMPGNISIIISRCSRKLLISQNIPADITEELLSPINSGNKCNLDMHGGSDGCFINSLQYIPGEDTLGMLYLSLRRLQDKKSTGAYYTPFYVVDSLIENLFCSPAPCGNTSKADSCHGTQFPGAVFDPACGTGNFLLRLPDDIPLEKIYGSDIDKMAIFIARINLALKYGIKTKEELNMLLSNLTVRNFLSAFGHDEKKFDIILGNPPWGYVFSADELTDIRGRFTSYNNEKNPESFALFVERALGCLNDRGILSFLLPESILSADTHRGIRKVILENSRVITLSYLGEVFHKVQCPSVILTMRRKGVSHTADNTGLGAENNEVSAMSSDEYIHIYKLKPVRNALIRQRHFTRCDYPISADSFLILADDKEQEILSKIEAAPHFTLEGQSEFALGIVTGSNKNLLKGHPGPGLEPILKGKDIEKFRTATAANYVHFDPDTFQQCAPAYIYRAEKKLLYRFIADEPILALDTQKTLSLNSANILIPRVFGYSMEYIMAVLNSDIISFYYKKTYKNLKVLRSYLEHLPIACCSSEKQKEIAELAVKLSCPETADPDRRNLQEVLNAKIAEIYGLDSLYFFSLKCYSETRI